MILSLKIISLEITLLPLLYNIYVCMCVCYASNDVRYANELYALRAGSSHPLID